MRTAFVTGGTGFVGSNLIEELVKLSWDVTALHRSGSNLSRLRQWPVKLVEGTLEDRASFERQIPEGVDAIFHVAGNISLLKRDRATQIRDNVDGTRNVVDAAIARGAKCMVHTSSVSAYAAQPGGVFDEKSVSTALESPVTYERTKYLAELEVKKGIQRGLRAVFINPSNILGRYDVTGWAKFIVLAHEQKLPGIPPGGGSFCDAQQVVLAHIAAVDKGGVGENYLLGGADATYLEFARIIGECLGKPVPRKAIPFWLFAAAGYLSEWGSTVTRAVPTVTQDMVRVARRGCVYVSSEKALRELGYEVRPLAEMVRTSHRWLTEQGMLS
jgi:dihydroflavonol-4-reductase